MDDTTNRRQVLMELLARFDDVAPGKPALIGIDGFDGAGKTHLAHELADLARAQGKRRIVNVSIDGFHRPKAERQAAGTGPEGFYRGSYNYDAFQRSVVAPLRSGEPVVPAVWNVDVDQPVNAEAIEVLPDTIVLVDGIFLQRPELREIWDASVWVEVPFEISIPRGNARYPGDHDPDPEAPMYHRYVGGQRLYLAEAQPQLAATWRLENRDLDHPVLS